MVSPSELLICFVLDSRLVAVQRVWAIGKPPPDRPCSFRNLKNVVVLPSVGGVLP